MALAVGIVSLFWPNIALISVRHADTASTTFQPFFLNFYKVHALATQFFLRMWNESGASKSDFPRLVALTHSQYVKVSEAALI